MQYVLSKKNIKQSIQNLSSFFKEKGLDIPKNLILEGFSKALFFKNWNTLEGVATKPDQIQYYAEKKLYLIEVECDLDQKSIRGNLTMAFIKCNCYAHIDNEISDNKCHHFEISFPEKTDNFLTAMFLFAESLKIYNVTRFDILRIVKEKESMMAYFDKKYNYDSNSGK